MLITIPTISYFEIINGGGNRFDYSAIIDENKTCIGSFTAPKGNYVYVTISLNGSCDADFITSVR